MVNYLAIVTADWCAHCQSFKKSGQRDIVINHFSKPESGAQIIQIEYKTEGQSGEDNTNEIKAKYPRLLPYIKVFPTFLLMNGSYDDPSSKLQLTASPITIDDKFNVVKDSSGKLVFQNIDRRIPTSTYVINWVADNIKNNKIFSTSYSSAAATSPASAPVPATASLPQNTDAGPHYMSSGRSANKRTIIPRLSEQAASDSAQPASKGTYRLMIVNNGVVLTDNKVSAEGGRAVIQSFQNSNRK